MTIKVGDKVRIKTKEQLLNNNWIEVDGYLINETSTLHSIDFEDCGQIVIINKIDDSDGTFYANCHWLDKCVIDEKIKGEKK